MTRGGWGVGKKGGVATTSQAAHLKPESRGGDVQVCHQGGGGEEVSEWQAFQLSQTYPVHQAPGLRVCCSTLSWPWLSLADPALLPSPTAFTTRQHGTGQAQDGTGRVSSRHGTAMYRHRVIHFARWTASLA